MKKYSSGSFADAALRVYGSEADTISSFPATIITNGGNITPWSIYGNTSGAQSVGDKTANLWNGAIVIDNVILNQNGTPRPNDNYALSEYIPVQSDTSYLYHFYHNTQENRSAYIISEYTSEKSVITPLTLISVTDVGDYNISFTTTSNTAYIRINWKKAFEENKMLIEGETVQPYEPYGYKLPVVIGSTTTNIYMADVLRMSSGADPVYDVMSSTGVITRNVDTDGSPLVTPTTESFTAPTLATVAGSQSFNIDTTVKPSSVDLTYTGWHTHADKQYSGGSWGALTSGQVLRRKRTTKKKT